MAAAATPARPVEIESFQRNAWNALCGPATHVLLYGGARSGKTFLWTIWLVLRALAKPKSTHAVVRYRFNHLKASVIYDTLPAACDRYWPGNKIYELNRSDWYADFVGGGRIYFGGLDDKERTEKILGQGHSTVILNEVSQISYGARLKAVTRLSQNRGLWLKEVCDENPPDIGHWTERLWIRGVDPTTGKPVVDRDAYAWAAMNPADNPYIPEQTKAILRALPPRERVRFWEGEFGQAGPGQLWTAESIESAVVDGEPCPMGSTLVVVDPSGCSGPEDERSDEIGISVVGLGRDGNVYVLADESGRLSPDGEDGWGSRVIQLVCQWGADAVCAEVNFGGAMVAAVIRSASAQVGGKRVRGDTIPFREIKASRGKHVRAEPVATLTTGKRVRFVGRFPDLFEQLKGFYTSGYKGTHSPDRADAMIHGVHALGVTPMPGKGLIDYYRESLDLATTSADRSAAANAVALVEMIAPSPIADGTFYSISGTPYVVQGGRIKAKADEVEQLKAVGFSLP